MDGLVDELRMHSVKHFFLRIIALTCMVTWIVITEKTYYLNFQIYNNEPLKNWSFQCQVLVKQCCLRKLFLNSP